MLTSTGGGLTSTDDDEYDRRPQRRKHEEPLAVTLRKQILCIAESVMSRGAVSLIVTNA